MDDGFAQTQALDFNESDEDTDDEALPGTERPPVRSQGFKTFYMQPDAELS